MTYVLDIPVVDGESQEETLSRISLRARNQWRHARFNAICFALCSFSYIISMVYGDSHTSNFLVLLFAAALVLMTVCTVQAANKAILNRLVITWADDWIRRILITKAVTEQAEEIARMFAQERRGNLLSHPDPEQLG